MHLAKCSAPAVFGTELEEVRGRRFIVNAPGLRRPATLLPTGLPVKRRAGDLSLIRLEIAEALGGRAGANNVP
jgi:hypothetical protein